MKKIMLILLILILNILLYDVTYASSFYTGSDIKSDSVTMLNMDTNTIVFEKNAKKRRSLASITKIMTYIVVYDHVKDIDRTKIKVLDEVLSPLDGTESSLAGIRAGDELSVSDLLHCLMIKSGNDAAVVLAHYVGGGSIDNFVSMMTQKAIEIGCEDTHFKNPHGLYDEDHYSTTSDICKMAKYALNIPGFSDITSKVEYDVFKDGRPHIRTTNKMQDRLQGGMYYYPYVKGIKTGYLNEAGFCLVSTAYKDGSNYMCAVLGGPQEDEEGNSVNFAMIDSKKLYSWAFDELSIKTLLHENDPITEINVDLAWRKDKLMLSPESGFSTVVPKNLSLSDMEMKFDIPESIDAPIERGDVIGTLYLSYGGDNIGTVKLISTETLPMSIVLYLIRMVKTIIFSKWFIIPLSIFVILFIFYIIFTVNKNVKKRKRKSLRNLKLKMY